MNEIVTMVPGGAAGGAFGVVGLLVMLAVNWQKIMNSFKADKLEAASLARISSLEIKYERQEETNQQMRLDFITAINLLVGMRMWLLNEGHVMPPHIQADFDKLMKTLDERKNKPHET